MKHQILIFSVTFFITLSLAYLFMASRTHEIIPGAVSIELPGRCEIIQFSRSLQPEHTIALSCPRMDMIRLWPLPVKQPWFEDWWERLEPIGTMGFHRGEWLFRKEQLFMGYAKSILD